jgi:hypothetical protein
MGSSSGSGYRGGFRRQGTSPSKEAAPQSGAQAEDGGRDAGAGGMGGPARLTNVPPTPNTGSC